MADRHALSLRTDALDVIVELLGELDGGSGFYDRLCAALCRLASMERAGLMLYDDVRQLVVFVGSHGIEPALLVEAYGTLEETPIAQVALAEDRVVEVTGELERWLPARYARIGGIETLTCTPVSAGGRWLGVIFADRGGTRFRLTDDERHAMWTLGKTAALAASVRIATSQQDRARLLQSRIDLAREIHERVVQRLFGVSLVLDWPEGVEVPDELEPLAQSVLAEALRNADKHAHPTSVRVQVTRSDGTFVLEVRNDGARPGARSTGTGMGLRLAAVEALQRGGVVEFGLEGGSEWRVRLLLPVGEASEE